MPTHLSKEVDQQFDVRASFVVKRKKICECNLNVSTESLVKARLTEITDLPHHFHLLAVFALLDERNTKKIVESFR